MTSRRGCREMSERACAVPRHQRAPGGVRRLEIQGRSKADARTTRWIWMGTRPHRHGTRVPGSTPRAVRLAGGRAAAHPRIFSPARPRPRSRAGITSLKEATRGRDEASRAREERSGATTHCSTRGAISCNSAPSSGWAAHCGPGRTRFVERARARRRGGPLARMPRGPRTLERTSEDVGSAAEGFGHHAALHSSVFIRATPRHACARRPTQTGNQSSSMSSTDDTLRSSARISKTRASGLIGKRTAASPGPGTRQVGWRGASGSACRSRRPLAPTQAGESKSATRSNAPATLSARRLHRHRGNSVGSTAADSTKWRRR